MRLLCWGTSRAIFLCCETEAECICDGKGLVVYVGAYRFVFVDAVGGESISKPNTSFLTVVYLILFCCSCMYLTSLSRALTSFHGLRN